MAAGVGFAGIDLLIRMGHQVEPATTDLTDPVSQPAERILAACAEAGIGRASAEAFGWQVADVPATSYESESAAAVTVAAIETAGARAMALSADLSQPSEVERVVDAAADRFGGVDMLVANAGCLLQQSRVADCSLEFWNNALAVNLTSTFLCCRTAAASSPSTHWPRTTAEARAPAAPRRPKAAC